MNQIEFIWDNRKNKANVRKYSVSFEEAQTAFYDEQSVVFFDPDHSDDEDRFVLLGISFKLRVLVVATVSEKVKQLLELFLPGRLTKQKKVTTGEGDHERALRLRQNEGTQKPLYEVLKATCNHAAGSRYD